MRTKHLDAEAFADVLVRHTRQVLDGPKIKARFEALERRIAELEARPMQKWAGTHIENMQYAEASLVTRGGSLWVAIKTTRTTPGTPGNDWRLIVRKGRA
jgi:hypothetical protein